MALGAVTSSRVAVSRSRPGLLLRLRVRLSLAELDARLARGEVPAGDALVSLRAAQLVSRRTRNRLAFALERACSRSSDGPAMSSAVPVDAEAVDAARPALEQLGAALRSVGVVEPRGVALTRRLLTEPESALFHPATSDALHAAAREALLALTGSGRG